MDVRLLCPLSDTTRVLLPDSKALTKTGRTLLDMRACCGVGKWFGAPNKETVEELVCSRLTSGSLRKRSLIRSRHLSICDLK